MPHVKFGGDVDLEALWQGPPSLRLSVPEEDLHIKFLESYLSTGNHALLLKYIVVEGRLTQHVQVILASTPSEHILKLDRSYPVLRTGGVKLLLAILTGWLEGRGLSVTATNLEAYLPRGRFYAAHSLGDSCEDP